MHVERQIESFSFSRSRSRICIFRVPIDLLYTSHSRLIWCFRCTDKLTETFFFGEKTSILWWFVFVNDSPFAYCSCTRRVYVIWTYRRELDSEWVGWVQKSSSNVKLITNICCYTSSPLYSGRNLIWYWLFLSFHIVSDVHTEQDVGIANKNSKD